MHPHILFLLLFLFLTLTTATQPPPPELNLIVPNDAVALLAFKSKADINNNLPYSLTTNRFAHCQWEGVKCAQGRVVRLFLQSYNLLGLFPPQTLTHLDQLRVLSLSNNSLSGPIPDLSPLLNLRSLYLDHNHFSAYFPLSLLSLHRLRILDFSHNNLSGFLPTDLTLLDRLNYLRLDSNRFTGALPPLNQTSLTIFNVSNNSLTGPIPVTPTLSRFRLSAFSSNPNLCGKIIHTICRNTTSPFFDSPDEPASPPSPFLQNAESQGVHLSPPSTKKQRKKTGIILGFVIGALILVAASLSIFALLKNNNKKELNAESKLCSERYDTDQQQQQEVRLDSSSDNTSRMGFVVSCETEAGKEKKISIAKLNKSGNLIFCDGELAFCSLEQLMRASAELLGRGTIGTTYKAVMDNQLTVTVKRLDAGKTAVTSGEAFERHLESVGVLRHPNLVAVRAFFQAKQERLIVYDYQPNGSLFNLIHGSRSTRVKPLHWTSCLKIAEDVALGLAYIHQASRLIHGNVKSSNILLGADFEALLTDYCLAILADSTWNDDLNSAAYKAPEMRKSSRRATTNSDVYAFGILLLELLTGKPPSQHPFLAPTDMADWVRAMREEDGGEDNRLDMLVEVAGFCSLTSPEQRPSMRQVVKMIQEIKENAMIDNSREASNEYL